MHFARPLLLPLLAAAAFGQQGSYSFTGQLILDNGLPVANAEVGVTLNGWNDVTDPVLTNAQGRFAFSGLPAGAYILTAHRNDLGSFFWGQTPQPGQVASLNLNEKFPRQDIVFRIARFGTIFGTVRDPAGNPMPNMQVWASRRSWGNGKAAMQNAGNTSTDDLGRFRIPSMGRGRYRICASATQGGEPASPVGYATFGQKSRDVYAETCLPDARSKATLAISPGQQVEIDVVFAPQIPVVVSGRVTNAPATQGVSVQLQSADQSGALRNLFGQTTNDTHTFEIQNVLPGKYWATTQGFQMDKGVQTQFAGRVPLTVGDSDVSNLELTLEPVPGIDVIVHAPPKADAITVGLRDADDPFGSPMDAQKQTDGSLRIALQHVGRYWLVTRTELCLSAAHLGNADAKDHALLIAPGTKDALEVSFTDQCGEIRGTVMDKAGKPVPNARNLILLSGTPDDPGDLFLASTDESGTFFYNGLIPGKYFLWAWNDDAEWNGELEDLRSMKDRQTVVEIQAGEKANVRIPLLNASKQAGK